MELTAEKIPIIKDGKRYLCTAELLDVKGGRHVVYVSEDGTVIKQEPLFRYNERIKRRATSSSSRSVDILPVKERLIVQQMRDFINDTDPDAYYVALVAGIRKVGKTTALKQLQASYPNAAYIDFQVEGTEATLETALERSANPLLLDEITHLRDFEVTTQEIYNRAVRNGTKVLITGSSSAHIVKLSRSKLGGGRARLFRLPPIMFVEYLYLTGRIPSYSDYSMVKNESFADYLLLKGLIPNLRIQFDADYFDTFYSEIKDGNEKRGLSNSLVDLKEGDLMHMANLIAYKLSEAVTYDKSIGHLLPKDGKIGKREYNSLKNLEIETPKWSKIDLSNVFVNESYKAVKDVTAQDKARILNFLLWAGLANIEFTKESDEARLQGAGDIVSRLSECTSTQELQQLFDEVSICFTTPLFYTRLGTDIVSRMGIDVESLCKGDMLGRMLEVYLRGAVTLRSVNRIMSSVKLDYIDGSGEVDVFDADAGLLIEITCSNKSTKRINLQNYMKDMELIRVCSTESIDDVFGCYHRIPYAKLCCMLDTGDIFSMLPRVKGSEQM